MPVETLHEDRSPRKRRRIATYFRRLAGRLGRGEAVAVDDERTVAVQPEPEMAVELFGDSAGKWRWRLRHDNGNIIADSGQEYASKQKAKQGLDSVRTNVPGAAVDVSE
jgi:uncharacterized protein YegP (UPF0339 family)